MTEQVSDLKRDHLAGKLPFEIVCPCLISKSNQLRVVWNATVKECDLPLFIHRILDGLFDSDVFYHLLATEVIKDLLTFNSATAYGVIAVISNVYRRIKSVILTRRPNSILSGLTILETMMQALEYTTHKCVFPQKLKNEIEEHSIVFKAIVSPITAERLTELMLTINQVLSRLKPLVDSYTAQKNRQKTALQLIRLEHQKLDEEVIFLIRGIGPTIVCPDLYRSSDTKKAWSQEKFRKANSLTRSCLQRSSNKLPSIFWYENSESNDKSESTKTTSTELPPIKLK